MAWYAWETGTGLLMGEFRERPVIPLLEGADPKTVVEFKSRDELRKAKKLAGTKLDQILDDLLDETPVMLKAVDPKKTTKTIKIEVQHLKTERPEKFQTDTEVKLLKPDLPTDPIDAIFWFVQKAAAIVEKASKTLESLRS